MTGTMKNKQLFDVGTRVRPAHAKLSTRVGTVIEYSQDGEGMWVHWDDDMLGNGAPRLSGAFSPMELIRA